MSRSVRSQTESGFDATCKPFAAGLDIEAPAALVTWLRDSGRLAAGEVPEVRVLAGGVSNRTVLVRRNSGEAWVLKQALPKLRVAVDWSCDPARIRREALGMTWLARLLPPGAVPPLLFEEPDQNLLAMGAVPEPHENWKTRLLREGPEPGHVAAFGRLLGTLHHESEAHAARLSAVFADRGFFEQLRLEPFYEYTASRVADAAPFLHRLTGETRACRESLVHGDYSPKNILVRGSDLVLLDHEVIHWGDPAFDLGFALAHLLSKGHHVACHRRRFEEACGEFIDAYRAAAPRADAAREERAVRHGLACLLARVAGRSPVDYLDARARERQAQAVLGLLARPPREVRALAREFLRRLDA